jgi:hypothetical protein
MEKYQGLKRARHHIVFLAALLFGSVLIYFLNELDLEKNPAGVIMIPDPIAPKSFTTPRPLEAEELEAAQVAWRYFEQNYQEKTGLVNSVDNYPSTTLWDTGNYMMALIAVERLGIITREVYEVRMRTLLRTLQGLTLYDDLLPNKVYNTMTLKMTDYANKESQKGIGWSAIDIGRVLIPLAYLNFSEPDFAEDAKAVIAHWHVEQMTQNGELYGMVVEKGKASLLQEGRLGYEQYTAKMFATFGIDITNAVRYDKYLRYEDIYGVKIPYDSRDKRYFEANNYVVMEPYMLDGIEFGWDYFSHEFSYRLYEAQKRRFEQSGILTAVTEDHIDQAPYFLYNSVFVNGQSWVSVDEKGKVYNTLKQLSTKAAFAMYALYRTPYSEKLLSAVKGLKSERGWYAGLYEQKKKPNLSLTCNTNAVILESLLYIEQGPLLQFINP